MNTSVLRVQDLLYIVHDDLLGGYKSIKSLDLQIRSIDRIMFNLPTYH
jgi:hypothetical protein